jgi:hypothetical protein
MCTMAVDQERLVCEIVPELRAFPYHLRFTKAINCKIPEPRASCLRFMYFILLASYVSSYLRLMCILLLASYVSSYLRLMCAFM